ncbi:hypothetical protein HY490_00115 [Candidatus Woesearchaeota archaeon]|nr:hypothetical protein [Candidatus Woesearchaeota archaeon]
MKIRNIKVTIKETKNALKEFATALANARKGERIVPHEEISFKSIDAVRKVLTEKRMQLMHVIKQHSPDSIYELAKIVNRDLKSVNTDMSILLDLGLVSVETLREERKRTKPRVEFDKLNVEIAI